MTTVSSSFVDPIHNVHIKGEFFPETVADIAKQYPFLSVNNALFVLILPEFIPDPFFHLSPTDIFNIDYLRYLHYIPDPSNHHIIQLRFIWGSITWDFRHASYQIDPCYSPVWSSKMHNVYYVLAWMRQHRHTLDQYCLYPRTLF